MKKPRPSRARADDLLPEYDFRRGTRGKYASSYDEGTNVVLLEPDVARAFRTGAEVNRALRTLIADGPRAGEPKP